MLQKRKSLEIPVECCSRISLRCKPFFSLGGVHGIEGVTDIYLLYITHGGVWYSPRVPILDMRYIPKSVGYGSRLNKNTVRTSNCKFAIAGHRY
jgi:hypothetical protein